MTPDRTPQSTAPTDPRGSGGNGLPSEERIGAAAPCDLDKLRQKTLDDDAFLAELRDIFREDLPGHLQGLRSALGQRRGRELAGAAHAFLGALRILEAAEACRLASRLQERAEAGDFAGAAAVLAALEVEAERLVAFLVAAHPP